MAAQRVGPTGYVLATDISASMLKLAADAVREAGLTNVETRVMDAENIDLAADSFDAAICQLGLFLFPNPAKVLRAQCAEWFGQGEKLRRWCSRRRKRIRIKASL